MKTILRYMALILIAVIAAKHGITFNTWDFWVFGIALIVYAETKK